MDNDDMSTSLNDLGVGGGGYTPNQQTTHDVMDELNASRSAQDYQLQQGNNGPFNDPRGPIAPSQAYQQNHNIAETKRGVYEMLTSELLLNFKEPLLVAVVCFLVHQEFFSNIILGFLPYSLRYLASPGSSSMLPSAIKGLIVGILFFFLKTFV